MPIMADPFVGVVLDSDILVLFAVDIDLLFAFFVLETDLVESLSALARVCL